MVKKFVIKPWMIIVASVVVIGGVSLFFVLNKGDDGTNPTPNKSSPKSKASFSPQQYNEYVTKTQEKIKKAQEAEEQCKKEKHPKTGKNYKSCEEKELAEIAKAELESLKEEEKEKEEKEGKKPKPMTPARLEALRRKAQQKAKRVVLENRINRIPGCAKANKKGCVKCKQGLFIDESGDCHGSPAECNHPLHMEHHDPENKISHLLVSNEMAETLIPKGTARCVCPHINTRTHTMHKSKNGICQTRYKTKDGKLVYKNFSEDGDVPYYATNSDKQQAVNDKKLHPDFLKDSKFYQEEGGDNLSLPQDGSFFKIVDGKIVKTEKTDKDKTLSYYAGGGVFCYPNDPDKNSNKALCTSNLSGGFIGTDKKVVTQKAKDYKGNVIEWEKDDPLSAWNRGDQIRSREEQKYAEEINDMMKNKGVVEGKFYKKVGDKIINTNFGDKDKSVFYINAGGLCYPNEGEDKNASRFCDTSGSWFKDDPTKSSLDSSNLSGVTKDNFVITPDCVF